MRSCITSRLSFNEETLRLEGFFLHAARTSTSHHFCLPSWSGDYPISTLLLFIAALTLARFSAK